MKKSLCAVFILMIAAYIAGCGSSGMEGASPDDQLSGQEYPIYSSAGVDDTDGDGIADEDDNCPMAANTDQGDCDEDGSGDACDASPGDCQDPGPSHTAKAIILKGKKITFICGKDKTGDMKAKNCTGNNCVWDWDKINVPDGINITPSGEKLKISGKIESDNCEKYLDGVPISVTACDSVAVEVCKSADLTIKAQISKLGVKADLSLPKGTVGEPYTYTIAPPTITGGSGKYTWGATVDGETSGLNFADGTISGTPTKAGKLDITVTATDTVTGAKGSVESQITILPKLRAYTNKKGKIQDGKDVEFKYPDILSMEMVGAKATGWKRDGKSLKTGVNKVDDSRDILVSGNFLIFHFKEDAIKKSTIEPFKIEATYEGGDKPVAFTFGKIEVTPPLQIAKAEIVIDDESPKPLDAGTITTIGKSLGKKASIILEISGGTPPYNDCSQNGDGSLISTIEGFVQRNERNDKGGNAEGKKALSVSNTWNENISNNIMSIEGNFNYDWETAAGTEESFEIDIDDDPKETLNVRVCDSEKKEINPTYKLQHEYDFTKGKKSDGTFAGTFAASDPTTKLVTGYWWAVPWPYGSYIEYTFRDSNGTILVKSKHMGLTGTGYGEEEKERKFQLSMEKEDAGTLTEANFVNLEIFLDEPDVLEYGQPDSMLSPHGILLYNDNYYMFWRAKGDIGRWGAKYSDCGIYIDFGSGDYRWGNGPKIRPRCYPGDPDRLGGCRDPELY